MAAKPDYATGLKNLHTAQAARDRAVAEFPQIFSWEVYHEFDHALLVECLDYISEKALQKVFLLLF